MNEFFTIVIAQFGLTISLAAKAQQNCEWHIDETNRTGFFFRGRQRRV